MCVGGTCVLILQIFFFCIATECFIFTQTYSVRRVEMGESRSVYVTLAFAGVALMVRIAITIYLLF